jgi:hypothetical protein
MKKHLIGLAALLAVSAVMASDHGNCGNGVGAGNATCTKPAEGGGSSSSSSASSKNTNRNSSSSNATGGSVVGSGNSTANGGRSSVTGSGNSTNANSATGGAVTGSGNSNNTNVAAGGAGGSAAGGAASVSGSGNATSTNSNQSAGGSSNVTVTGDTYEAPRMPVATAYAAPITATNGTCMGSSSGGAQAPGFGVSIASTWKDDGCERRYNSIRLQELGNRKAATYLMCQDASVRVAMEDAGTPCPAVKDSAKVVNPGNPGVKPFEHSLY